MAAPAPMRLSSVPSAMNRLQASSAVAVRSAPLAGVTSPTVVTRLLSSSVAPATRWASQPWASQSVVAPLAQQAVAGPADALVAAVAEELIAIATAEECNSNSRGSSRIASKNMNGQAAADDADDE